MTQKKESRTPIAIVGIGCRFPGGAQGPERFWSMLTAGTDAIGPIPADRWDADAFFDPDYRTKGKMHVKEGGFIDRVDRFDAAFFGISPVEAKSMDPAHRLLLQHTVLALEDAGIPIESLDSSKTGVFVGASSSEYAGILQGYTERSNISAHTNTGSSPAITANRISYVFNLKGPSFAVDTACSSSLIAAHLACRSIWSRESDAAVVAGVNLILKPELHIGFSTAGFLSPSARSRSFDAAADGYVRSEGVGVLILKPLDAALRDGNRIYAAILGSAINEDGRTDGIAQPDKDAQVAVMRAAYADAGIDPSIVGLVEAHGTGTAAGDPVECSSIGQVIGAGRTDRCLIGSVKSNIGHTELASGSAGLIKLALSLFHGQAPPVVHFRTPNPKIDFDGWRLQVPVRVTPVPAREGIRYGAVNSFGFGGANAHLVLRSVPPAETRTTGEGPLCAPLFISARSEKSLRRLAGAYADLLEKGIDGRELAQQVIRHRSRLEDGLALTDPRHADAAARLRNFARGRDSEGVIPGRRQLPEKGQTAFVFSGQGPQWWGMGRELFSAGGVYRDTVEEVSDLLKQIGWLKEEGSDLVAELHRDEASSRMNETAVVQPALFALQLGLARLWMSHGVMPDMVVGHSIGEVAAACVSGALTVAEAVKVVYWRSRCQSRAAGRGRMLAVGLSAEDASGAIGTFGGKIDVAAINGPAMVTLAGDADALALLARGLEERGVFVRFLVVDVPFHSHLLDDVARAFCEEVPAIVSSPPRIPLYSTVTGLPVEGAVLDNDYWAANIRQPVQFYPTVQRMARDGAAAFIEMSPHPILANGLTAALSAAGTKGIVISSLRRKEPDIPTFSGNFCALWLAGGGIDRTVFGPGGAHLREPLPAYPFAEERFWLESPEARADRIGTRVHAHLASCTSAADDGNDQIWQVELDARCAPYIRDHRVQGPLVFPGAGHVDLALAAGMASFGDRLCFLEDIEFIRPLFVREDGEPDAVQLHVVGDEGDYTIAGRTAERDTPWTIFSKGRMNCLGEAFCTEPVSLKMLKARIVHPVALPPLFDVLDRGGLVLGDTFRGIRALWRGEGESLARIEAHPSIVHSLARHCIHPALLDAGFQSAFGILAQEERMGVYIPRRIGRVRFAGPPAGTVLYAWARAAGTDREHLRVDIRIFNEDGSDVLQVEGFEGQYLKGSRGEVDAVDSLFYRYELRPCARRDELVTHRLGAALAPPVPVDEAVRRTMDRHRADPLSARFFDALSPAMDELAMGVILDALRSLDSTLADGAFIDGSRLLDRLGVAERHERLLHAMFDHLVGAGLARRESAGWRMSEWPKKDVRLVVARAQTDLAPFAREIEFFARTGAELAAVLRGETDPGDVLFAGNRFDELADYYANSFTTVRINQMAADAFCALLSTVPAGRPLRVLELGAGTGGLTRHLLPLVEERNGTYLFTDLSPLFLARARETFKYNPAMEFAVLDIETDPAAQGQIPHSWDIVVASNVLHATEDLRRTLANCRSLLCDNGVLCLVEVTRAPRYLDLSFGMTEGWWRFRDDVRTDRCTLSAEAWRSVLAESGFPDVADFSDGEGPDAVAQTLFVARARSAAQGERLDPRRPNGIWLILGDNRGVSAAVSALLRERGDRCIRLTCASKTAPTGVDRFDFDPACPDALIDHLRTFDGPLLGALHTASLDLPPIEDSDPTALLRAQGDGAWSAIGLGRVLSAVGNESFLWLVTAGVHGPTPALSRSPMWGLGRVMMNELTGVAVRLLDVDGALRVEDCARIVQEMCAPCAAPFEEEIVLRDTGRFANVLVRDHRPRRIARAVRTIPSCGATVSLRRSSSFVLDDCIFVPSDTAICSDDDVAIDVHVAGLNFRDVMVAGGTLPREAVEGGLFGDALGLECAGIVTQCGRHVSHVRVGDAVMALARGTLSGRVVARGVLTRKIPSGMGMADAAALPMALLTAWYSLVTLGRLEAGERVLIHGAAGGVGLVAVQLAQAMGAEVFATASRPKHDLLRELGVRYVFDSRSAAWADGVDAAAEGRGVNVVLNSLSGVQLTRGLRLLAPMGRFIEIGKVDLYANRRLAMGLLKDNGAWFSVDIDRLLVQAPQKMAAAFDEALHFFAVRRWPALSVSVHPLSGAADALALMAKGNHRGKIALAAADVPVHPAEHLTVARDGVFLIAGGTRGFGLAVGTFLADRGARHLALLSRGGLRGEEETRAVAALRHRGVNVEIFATDVTDRLAVERVIAAIHREERPLRGVFQSTLVLDDAMLDRMTRPQLDGPMAPKVAGTWNLHLATIGIPLDWFVSFSSISSIYGFPGQANYAAANRFLDDFALYRRSLGLPGTTINWGALQGAGFVERSAAVRSFLSNNGWETLTLEEALSAMERVLLEGHPQMAVFRADWSTVGRSFPAGLSSLRFAHLHGAGAAEKDDGDLRVALTAAAPAARAMLLQGFIAGATGAIIGADGAKVDRQTPLNRLGLDSLMANQLRSVLTSRTGVEISLMQIMAGPTIADLANEMASRFENTATSGSDRSGGQWVTRVTPVASPQLRLFCLPYLGAGASIYSRWQVGENVEVCAIALPGREERIGEPPLTDAHELIETMAGALLPLLDVPFAIYGHSFGGNLAFSLASFLQERHGKVPDRVFIGAAVPPGIDNPLEEEFRIADKDEAARLSDDALRALLQRLGAPSALIHDEAAFSRMAPALRADLAIAKQRLFPSDHRLRCPIVAIAARGDHLYSEQLLRHWQRHSDDFSLEVVNGGHLFVHEDEAMKHILKIMSHRWITPALRSA